MVEATIGGKTPSQIVSEQQSRGTDPSTPATIGGKTPSQITSEGRAFVSGGHSRVFGALSVEDKRRFDVAEKARLEASERAKEVRAKQAREEQRRQKVENRRLEILAEKEAVKKFSALSRSEQRQQVIDAVEESKVANLLKRKPGAKLTKGSQEIKERIERRQSGAEFKERISGTQPFLEQRQVDTFRVKGKDVPITQVFHVTPAIITGSTISPGGERVATQQEQEFFRSQPDILVAGTGKSPDIVAQKISGIGGFLGDVSFRFGERTTGQLARKISPDVPLSDVLGKFASETSPALIFIPGKTGETTRRIYSGAISGVTRDVIEQPLKQLVIFGAGQAIGGGLQISKNIYAGTKLARSTTTAAKIAKGTGKVIGFGTKVGIGGAFAFGTTQRIIAARTPEEKGGVIGLTIKDIALIGGGTRSGKRAFTLTKTRTPLRQIEKPTFQEKIFTTPEGQKITFFKITGETRPPTQVTVTSPFREHFFQPKVDKILSAQRFTTVTFPFALGDKSFTTITKVGKFGRLQQDFLTGVSKDIGTLRPSELSPTQKFLAENIFKDVSRAGRKDVSIVTTDPKLISGSFEVKRVQDLVVGKDIGIKLPKIGKTTSRIETLSLTQTLSETEATKVTRTFIKAKDITFPFKRQKLSFDLAGITTEYKKSISLGDLSKQFGFIEPRGGVKTPLRTTFGQLTTQQAPPKIILPKIISKITKPSTITTKITTPTVTTKVVPPVKLDLGSISDSQFRLTGSVVDTGFTPTETKDKVRIREAQKPRAIFSSKEISKFQQLPKVKQLEKIQQLPKVKLQEKQKTKQQVKQAQKLKQKQKLKLSLLPRLISPPTKKQRTRIPRATIFPLPTPPLKRKTTQPRRQTFGVQVRRFGVFRPIAKGVSFAQALSIGRLKVGKTLAATFKLTPEFGKGARGLRTPKGFRRKVTKTGIEFIERRGLRLSTRPETKEIQFFQRKKVKKKRRKKK